MSTGIAIGALVVALAAIAVAVAAELRARRVLRALARELVELRTFLQQEAGGATPGGGDRLGEGPGDAAVEGVAERLAALEARVRGMLSRPAPAAAADGGPAPDLAEHITRALARRGYAHVVVLDVRSDDEALVEAEHDGVLEKGIARLASDGRVTFAATSSLRAFP